MRRGRLRRWRHQFSEGLALLAETLTQHIHFLAEGEEIPLLAGQGRIEAGEGVVLEGKLRLQLLQKL